MWKRNLLFALLCVAGLGTLSAMLLERERIKNPVDFNPGRYGSPDYKRVIDAVNREFENDWSAVGVAPAKRAETLTIARRLSLALTGTVPSLEEIRVIEQQSPDHQIEWWVSRLLEDRRCSDYVAERFARAYVGTDQGPFLLFRRRRFVTWLSDQLASNRPYDEIVHELITAKGLWTDEPAVNFITASLDQNNSNQPDEIKLAGRAARAFLATRLDCLQCHDDKLGQVELGTEEARRYGLQSDFHQLAAYFSQAETSLFGVRDGSQDYKYKYLNADEETLVQPAPPFHSDLVSDVTTRRAQLAQWITHPRNKPFARATVNRIWAIMFGKPLVEPIDSIPIDGPFPPALETLADDFVDHQYDIKRLIRLIAATNVYQLDSQADHELTEAHEQAWACFPLSRLRPEQVAGSIIQAASLTTIDANSHIVAQLTRFFQQSGFVQRYGDTGEDEFIEGSGTITQRLLMMNGELVRDRTNENLVTNAATRIAALAPNDATAVEIAYLAVLTRRPNAEEKELFTRRLNGSRRTQRNQALEDIYWVLINSSEFSWNH